MITIFLVITFLFVALVVIKSRVFGEDSATESSFRQSGEVHDKTANEIFFIRSKLNERLRLMFPKMFISYELNGWSEKDILFRKGTFSLTAFMFDGRNVCISGFSNGDGSFLLGSLEETKTETDTENMGTAVVAAEAEVSAEPVNNEADWIKANYDLLKRKEREALKSAKKRYSLSQEEFGGLGVIKLLIELQNMGFDAEAEGEKIWIKF